MEGVYQNLDEAEYAVALFTYLIINGIKPSNITILTTSKGQSFLIHEIIQKKTSWHQALGSPDWVGTFDQFQGKHNEYIIVSLVRSKSRGGLLESRKWAQLLTRASKGLYIFGNLKLFSSSPDFKRVLESIEDKSYKLALATEPAVSTENYTELFKISEKIFKSKATTIPSP